MRAAPASDAGGAADAGRSPSLARPVARAVGSVVGIGLLILPGVAATTAGPASVVAWALHGVLGACLALTFAALAPAAGVGEVAGRAFGPAWPAAVGWFYVFGFGVGQAIVGLAGGFYAAAALSWDEQAAFAVAAAVVGVGVAANLRGARIDERARLLVSAAVVGLLLIAFVAASRRVAPRFLEPFAPHGGAAVGRAAFLLTFAFVGWESLLRLPGGGDDPARARRRVAVWTVALAGALSLGVAIAVVAARAYGDPGADRAVLAALALRAGGPLAQRGVAGVVLAVAALACVRNVAAAAALGRELSRAGALPAWIGGPDDPGAPRRAAVSVGACAGGALVVAYAVGRGFEPLLVVPGALGLAIYAIGAAAGVRLLAGSARAVAWAGLVAALAIARFGGAATAVPLVLGAAAMAYRRAARRGAGERSPGLRSGA